MVADVLIMAPEPQQPPSDLETATASPIVAHHSRSKEDLKKIQLDRYVNKDLLHSAALLDDQERRTRTYGVLKGKTGDYTKVREHRDYFPPAKLYGAGYSGYGNGHTDGQSRMLYPSHKPRLGNKKTPRLKIKRKDSAKQAELHEEMLPIRLDVDWDKVRFRDTFTWNLADRMVDPNLFANQLVEDLGLTLPAAEPVLQQISQQMKDQLNDFFPHVYIQEEALDPELPYSAYKNEEMRINIKLNITIGPLTLEDKFEWDINNSLNSPEEFAQSMSRELSLSGEFTTAIAHAIREQSQLFTRTLYIMGHPFDGRPPSDAELISAFLPSPLLSVFRPQQQAKEYAPFLYELTDADLEKSEVIYSREQRRQKRSVNRRGGPTLPDLKDRQRTVRTLVVSSVVPGAAATVEESRLYKPVAQRKRPGQRDGDLTDSSDSEGSQPDSPAMAQQAGTTRTRVLRGAATTAQQRMANIGRSETPEAMIAHHHETRTSARRFGGRDAREESVDNPRFVITLKVGKDKLRRWTRDQKSGSRPANIVSTPSFNRAASAVGTPAQGNMGPPSTPGVQNQALQLSTTPGQISGQIGGVDAPPLIPGQPALAPVGDSLVFCHFLSCISAAFGTSILLLITLLLRISEIMHVSY